MDWAKTCHWQPIVGKGMKIMLKKNAAELTRTEILLSKGFNGIALSSLLLLLLLRRCAFCRLSIMW